MQIFKKPVRFPPPRRPSPGQSLPEYALILALISVFCLATLVAFGEKMTDFLVGFATEIQRHSQ